jgi:hypothetical protein
MSWRRTCERYLLRPFKTDFRFGWSAAELQRKYGLYRQHVCPYRARAQANEAAEKLQEALDLRTRDTILSTRHPQPASEISDDARITDERFIDQMDRVRRLRIERSCYLDVSA